MKDHTSFVLQILDPQHSLAMLDIEKSLIFNDEEMPLEAVAQTAGAMTEAPCGCGQEQKVAGRNSALQPPLIQSLQTCHSLHMGDVFLSAITLCS